MKRTIAILVAVIVLLLLSGIPVISATLGVSPSTIEVEVPAEGTATVSFQVHYYSGDIKVSLVDIPLKVEPETLHVDSSNTPTDVKLTLYGDESLGSKIYKGYIRFLGISGGMVGVAVRARATVTNMVEGETPVLVEPEAPLPTSTAQPETSSTAPESETNTQEPQGVTILPASENPPTGDSEAPKPPLPPSKNGGNDELPIVAIIGIIAGAVVVIVLIIVLLRRPRY